MQVHSSPSKKKQLQREFFFLHFLFDKTITKKITKQVLSSLSMKYNVINLILCNGWFLIKFHNNFKVFKVSVKRENKLSSLNICLQNYAVYVHGRRRIYFAEPL